MAHSIDKGVFLVAPTVFDEEGRLDVEAQKRAIDFMIDAGSTGIAILANFSEQLSLTDAIEGPWDGEEGIALLPDLQAGAIGAMSGGGYPDGVCAIFDAYEESGTRQAAGVYEKWLPLISYENHQCGPATCKILTKEGGVIRSDHVRHPFAVVPPAARAGLLEVARPLDPLVLRWAR